MKKILFYSLLMVLAAWNCSCSDSTETIVEEEKASVSFQLTRTSVNYDFREHVNRLYVGERKQEHEKEELHCRHILNLFSQYGDKLEFGVIDLEPQWYKFIVLSVPKISTDRSENEKIFTEEVPGTGSCDLNKQMIDYSLVLQKGPGSVNPSVALPDGDIFRQVINRWAKGHLMVKENMTLTRLNGQLELNMGILADQFEQKVTSIELQLNTPTRMYLTDNNLNVVKTALEKSVTFTTYPEDFRDVPEAQRKEHVITVNLLPGMLKGDIVVHTADETFTYALDKHNFEIRTNTRTRLRFNGLYQGFFKVEYAGFEDTKLDAEEDWNGGWEVQPQP